MDWKRKRINRKYIEPFAKILQKSVRNQIGLLTPIIRTKSLCVVFVNVKLELMPYVRIGSGIYNQIPYLCSDCYAKKGYEFERRINFCNSCSKKLGFIRYNPKPKWKMTGQMCKNCWDSKNISL
jgi:hypothetical protein